MGAPQRLEVVLASTSPRRHELLRAIGLPFRAVAPDVVESNDQSLGPVELACQQAVDKARAVARSEREAIVIGADTIVLCDGQVLGKPIDGEDAVRMLRILSGRCHEVITGVAVVAGSGCCRGQLILEHEQTTVEFRRLTERDISAYVATGEPADKAGAYGIQGRGSLFVRRIDGCYYNVVGLPVARLGDILARCGMQVL